MKSRNKERFTKWVLPFAIPEFACMIFFIYGLVHHNMTYCEAAGIFAMIYIWMYTIVCTLLLPDDFIEKLKSRDKEIAKKTDKK